MIFAIILCFASAIWAAGVDASSMVPTFQDKNSTAQPRATITQEPLVLEHAIDSTYIVGPGDFFEILTPKGLDVVQISPEGSISIPECGMTWISDLPLNGAKEKILQLLTVKYDRKFVQAQIVKMKKIPVSILGAVSMGGRKVVDPQSRLNVLIGACNGFMSNANKNAIKIYRQADTLTVDYSRYENFGEEQSNPILNSGDIVFVPIFDSEGAITLSSMTSSFVMACDGRKTLSEYMVFAGIKAEEHIKWARIKRPDGTMASYELAKARDFVLAPKTEVELWNREPVVYVGGAVARVGVGDYNPNFHAIDYIAASGVTIITGDWSRVSVIRDGKSFSIDPYKEEILPGDYIEIPRSVYESVKDVTLFLASLLSVIATAIIISSY